MDLVTEGNKPYDYDITNSKVKVHIIDWPICTGKTRYLVDRAYCSAERVVYIAPSYDELNRFIEEFKKLDSRKKVVILKGKSRLCIRKNKPLECNDCPYKKKLKVKPPDNIYHEKLYQTVCPYYNLLRESQTTDIILSHLYTLYELYKNMNLPYNPRDTIMMIDEGEFVYRSLFPREIRLVSLKEVQPYRWLNIEDITLFKLIDWLRWSDKIQIPENWRKIFVFLYDVFNPYAYATDKPIKDSIKSKIPEITEELKRLVNTLWPDPLEFENAIMKTNILKDDEKRLLIDLDWTIYSLKEIRVVNTMRDFRVDEVWLVPMPVPLIKLHNFILEHKGVYLSTGSLSERDEYILRSLDVSYKRVEPVKSFRHEHILVMTAGRYRYSPYWLSYHLSQDDYIVHVIHSSFEGAEEFSKRVDRVDVSTPRSIEEFYEDLNKGVKIFNIVQNSSLAMNLRLPGDVSIVNTYITKHVGLYGNKEELVRRCVLTETYQALGRIINNDGRPVALVMSDNVYTHLREKFESVGATVETFNEQKEALEKIKRWIPNPIGRQYGSAKKPHRAVFEKVFGKHEVKGHRYAQMVIHGPEEWIGKRARVTVELLEDSD